jgi:hypothetical protein
VNSLPNGNKTLTQVWYGNPATNDDAGCNNVVAGSKYTGSIGSGYRCQTTYLRNAVEIFDDGIGNDNGLCESGETCLFLRNNGSYQGHGNLVSAGTFTNGTLTGITLLKYSSNGR